MDSSNQIKTQLEDLGNVYERDVSVVDAKYGETYQILVDGLIDQRQEAKIRRASKTAHLKQRRKTMDALLTRNL
jgi:hypothetical protein